MKKPTYFYASKIKKRTHEVSFYNHYQPIISFL